MTTTFWEPYLPRDSYGTPLGCPMTRNDAYYESNRNDTGKGMSRISIRINDAIVEEVQKDGVPQLGKINIRILKSPSVAFGPSSQLFAEMTPEMIKDLYDALALWMEKFNDRNQKLEAETQKAEEMLPEAKKHFSRLQANMF